MQKIEITVAPDGTSKVETHGFVGNGCRKASAFIEQALGKTIKESLKADFFRVSESARQELKQ